MSLRKRCQYFITKLTSLKEKDHIWENVNTKLLNEKLVHKEKGESSQTIETTLQVQKHFKSKKNTTNKSKDICNYNKQACHMARDYKKKKYDAMHK